MSNDQIKESSLPYIAFCTLITISCIAGIFGLNALGFSMSDAKNHWTHHAGVWAAGIWGFAHIVAFCTAFSRGIEKAW